MMRKRRRRSVPTPFLWDRRCRWHPMAPPRYGRWPASPAATAPRGDGARVPDIVTDIKFCGMTRAEDVLAAAELGAAYVGCVFAGGPRRRTASDAASLLVVLSGPRA